MGLMKSAMTYFPAEQYHRQRKFHFCVRDGNRCFLSLIVTDKSLNILSDPQGGRRGRCRMEVIAFARSLKTLEFY